MKLFQQLLLASSLLLTAVAPSMAADADPDPDTLKVALLPDEILDHCLMLWPSQKVISSRSPRW